MATKTKTPVKKAGLKFKPGKEKSWIEKVNDTSKTHKVEVLDKDWVDMTKGEKMLIATPRIIDDYINYIPKGKSLSLLTMRKELADEYGADNTCPLTTGIFLRIVSEAAYEQIEKGIDINKVTPFWRVVEENSPLNQKLSFGPEFVKAQRQKENLTPSS